MEDKRLTKLRNYWRENLSAQVMKAPSPSAVVEVGRVLEFTEEDRRELLPIAHELLYSIEHRRPGMALLILKEFKIVQRAIARSHAT